MSELVWPKGYCLDPNGKMIAPEGKGADFDFGYEIGYREAFATLKRAALTLPMTLAKAQREDILDQLRNTHGFIGEDDEQVVYLVIDATLAALHAKSGGQPVIDGREASRPDDKEEVSPRSAPRGEPREVERLREALRQIAAYRPLTFAECSDAEAIIGLAEDALAAPKAKPGGSGGDAEC